MGQRPEDCIEDAVEILANVLCKKSQDEVAVLLEKRILVSVTSISCNIGQMLRSVQLDHKQGFGTNEIHLHLAALVELNRELLIQSEPAGCRR